MSPGYIYGKPLEHFSIIRRKQSHESFKTAEHFGGEMKHFSNDTLQDLDPESDREEELADMPVLEGVMQALKTGTSVTLEPCARARRIDVPA